MTIPDAHGPRTEDFQDRFRRHMPRSNDLTLIVLKGHLLMEEQINRLITISLPNPGALEQARPNLFLRLAIARALYKPRTFDSLFNAAEALNTLRNRLAHHLEHPQIEAH